MSLNVEQRRIIVQLELEKSDGLFAQSDGHKKNKFWDTLANRLYYAAFHAVSALLISNKLEVKSHKGAAVQFHRHFVKNGMFTLEEGRFYSRMQAMREEADYNCHFNVTESEAIALIEPTRLLIEKIKKYINEKDNDND